MRRASGVSVAARLKQRGVARALVAREEDFPPPPVEPAVALVPLVLELPRLGVREVNVAHLGSGGPFV